MVENGSAGGVKPNADISRPSNEAAIKQVAESVKGKLPEFTTDPKVAGNFGLKGVVAVFEIDSRYLTWGSGTEGGWCCLPEAPITLKGWEEGRKAE
jgi:hypothetical protein